MKIVVLAGGLSTERDVSLTSGSMVCSALRKRGHQAVLVDAYLGRPDIDKSQDIFLTYGTGEVETPKISKGAPDLEKIRNMRPDPQVFFGPNVLELCGMADIVFLALHGEHGENGKVQASLDLMGIPYTGTGALGSAIAMHKGISKKIFLQEGIPTPEGFYLKKGEVLPENCPLPCVIKPCSGGSSIGVFIVHEQAKLAEALEEAFTYEEEVVVERYIKGREFSVGVLDGKALPIIEIIPKCGFYDYENKYQAGNTVEECPAKLDEKTTKQLQHYAEAVYRALKLEAYGRVDFLLEEGTEVKKNVVDITLGNAAASATAVDETSDNAATVVDITSDSPVMPIYCLEANTLPGMTPISLLPQEAAQMGLDYGALCERIIEISLKK